VLARLSLDQSSGSLSQSIKAEEGQIAIGSVVIHCTFGKFEGTLWWTQVSVKIFQAQDVRVFEAVGKLTHLFNADLRNVGKS
jgi:hypothetical protein